MKTKLIGYCLGLVLISVLLIGCETHYDDNHDHPHVQIASIVTVDRQAGEFAKMFVEFENIGEQVAYDISGTVSLNTADTILETSAFFISDIEPGQSVIGEISFTSINTHNEYLYHNIDFGWYDFWDNYYD